MASDFKDITRGGQTFLHTLRMMGQIGRMVMMTTCLIFLMMTLIWTMAKTTPQGRQLEAIYLKANLYYSLNKRSTQVITLANRQRLRISNASLLANLTLRKNHQAIKTTITTALYASGLISLITGLGMLLWFSQRGKRIEANQALRGARLIDEKTMVNYLNKRKDLSDLSIGQVHLPKQAELQHFLVHGTTGTGKSYLIRTLLYQIRARKNKAIVYDKHGTFVEKFYNPETDILLNPMDERSAPWHIWAECRDEADLETLANALMPMPPSSSADPFWINAARSIFVSLAKAMKQQGDLDMRTFLHHLFSVDLSNLSELLKGTEAEILVSEKAEKTALSVKSVLSTYIKPLKYLKQEAKTFSIRDWVSDENQQGWLFISSRADKHESLKPLISTWLDVVANALMSLPENPDRRLWMVIDELASLQRLPYLPSTFAESRKFGGCLIAGLQNYFQLQKIYGADGAKEIVDLCNIRVFFRAPSNEVAKWVSKEIGEIENLETREGLSYGANTVRDGVTLNHQTITKPAVPATEIANLPDLQGFLCIPQLNERDKGNVLWPVARLKLTWEAHLGKEPAYVERELDPIEETSASEVQQERDVFDLLPPRFARKVKGRKAVDLDSEVLF